MRLLLDSHAVVWRPAIVDAGADSLGGGRSLALPERGFGLGNRHKGSFVQMA